MSKFFSKNLKYLRTIKKISQQELADKLKNINRSTISRWESNDIDPTIGNVISVANLLGVPVADLVGKDIQNDDLYRNDISINSLDELEILFLDNYNLLNDDDKDTIRFIIEKRVKENDN